MPVDKDARASAVGVDPGERTFMTLYSPDGFCAKLGMDTREDLEQLRQKADQQRSHLGMLGRPDAKTRPNGQPGPRRRRLRRVGVRAMLCTLQRIRDKVDAMHWECARWLCDKSKKVVIGKLDSGRVIQKEQAPRAVPAVQPEAGSSVTSTGKRRRRCLTWSVFATFSSGKGWSKKEWRWARW